MDIQLKRRIAFALAMGIFTTGIISFVIISLNLGFTERFPQQWLRSWLIAYAIATPAILMIGPRVQARVERLIPLGEAAPQR